MTGTAARRLGAAHRQPPGWIGRIGPVAVNQVGLALSLGLLAVVTSRALGPSDRGVIVVFMTLSSLLMLIGSLGTNTAARVRLVAQGQPLLLEHYLALVVVLSIAQVALSVGAGWAVLHVSHSLVDPLVLVLFVPYSVLNLACLLLRDGLYAFGHNYHASFADTLGATGQFLLVGAAWGADVLTLNSALACVTVGESLELLYLLRRYRQHGLPLRIGYSRPALVRHVRAGVPALVGNVGQAMVMRFDRLLLGVLATTAQVGIYSVAATMTETLLLIPASIAQVIFHRVAAGHVTVRGLSRLRCANLALTAACAGALAVAAPPIVRLLFGHAFAGSVGPLRVLLIAAVAIACYQVDVACISASDRLARASWITSIGFALVVILDIALIPQFKAMGAAAASVVAYSAMAALAAASVHRLARPRVPPSVVDGVRVR